MRIFSSITLRNLIMLTNATSINLIKYEMLRLVDIGFASWEAKLSEEFSFSDSIRGLLVIGELLKIITRLSFSVRSSSKRGNWWLSDLHNIIAKYIICFVNTALWILFLL